jgi:F0F1-type ATP synthase epsilon subunit
VTGKLCAVLAEEAVNVSELDRSQIEKSLDDLQFNLGQAGDDFVRKANILRDIEIAKMKLEAIR